MSTDSPAYAQAKADVAWANAHIPLATVLILLGTDGYARRPDCPVCGERRALKFKDDEPNAAWCFSCQKFCRPVDLWREYTGKRAGLAARDLMRTAGITPENTPPDPVKIRPVDSCYLHEALREWCRQTDPQWTARQYEPDTAGLLARCLGVLDVVRTEEDCRKWLAGMRRVMGLHFRSRGVEVPGDQ